MSAEAIVEAVHVLNPRTLDRARRLSCALALLRAGMERRQACGVLRLRFSICQSEAWRMVDMAADIAAAPKQEGG